MEKEIGKMEEILNDDDEEEFCYENYGDSNQLEDDSDETMVYKFVEALQEIVIQDEFYEMRNAFFKKYNNIFTEEKDENSHEAYTIFKKYVSVIEGILLKELNSRIKNFEMERVISYLQENKESEILDEELLEMLLSLNDFEIFKTMMLDYKKNLNSDLGQLELNVISLNTKEKDEKKLKENQVEFRKK